MSNLQVLITSCAGIILFLYAMENFSKEIKLISGENFRKFIAKWTKNPVIGVVLGTAITSLVQSSTATSVITVSLVNSGIISFFNSLGLIFGANIGSSITSQLVAFKVTSYAPIFILVGFLLGLIKTKYSFLAKSVFFFGFVFFSLNLISDALAPMKDDPYFIQLLKDTNTIAWGLFIGFAFTAIVNSSSVTMGILIIFAQQNLIGIDQALPIILGAKIGTTLTAAVSSLGLSQSAKRTAAAHVLFNVGGALLFVPLLGYSHILTDLSKESGQVLANALLIFNLVSTLIFLILIKPFAKMIAYFIPEEGEKIRQPFADVELKEKMEDNLKDILNEIQIAFKMFEAAYMNSVVGIEASHANLINKAHKIRNTIDFYQKEISERMLELQKNNVNSSTDPKLMIQIFQTNEYLKQIISYVDQLEQLFKELDKRSLRLSLKMIFSVRAVTQTMFPLLETLDSDIRLGKNSDEVLVKMNNFEKVSYQENEVYLTRLIRKDLTSGNFFVEFLTLHNRLVEDLIDFKTKMVQIKQKLEIPAQPQDPSAL